MITLFIGANNVCVLCTPPVTRLPDLSDADIFENDIRLVLERLRTEVGKSFINLVGLFNVNNMNLFHMKYSNKLGLERV